MQHQIIAGVLCSMGFLLTVACATEKQPVRQQLSRPTREPILAPLAEGEGYTNLRMQQDGPLVRFDWVDSDGDAQWLYWRNGFFLNVTVAASVDDGKDRQLLYRYRVHLGKDSPQQLANLIIQGDHTARCAESGQLQWSAYHLPTDVWKQPLYRWSLRKDHLLSQGATAGPLTLVSLGLPGIVACWASSVQSGATCSTEPIEPVDEAFSRFGGNLLENAVCGVTIGPLEDPPKPADLLLFLQVAKEQGWAGEKETAEDLRRLLRAAVTAEKRGDDKALRARLTALEKAVDEYYKAKPPGITSEVKALLGVNAAYLRQRTGKEEAEEQEQEQEESAPP